VPNTVPGSTDSPSLTDILDRTPVTGAWISCVILYVSISTTGSPILTGSPTALREVPGIPRRLRLDDILAALKQLDDETDRPPRGGLAMRLPRLSKLDCVAYVEPQRFVGRHAPTRRHRSMQASRTSNHSRWTREANVRRYRKLLNTHLTDIERSFIERRLAEELHG